MNFHIFIDHYGGIIILSLSSLLLYFKNSKIVIQVLNV